MSRTIQWLNSNKYRRYPFVEDAALLYVGPADARLILPDDIFVDCQCAVYTATTGNLALRRISKFQGDNGLDELRAVFALGAYEFPPIVVPENAGEFQEFRQFGVDYTLRAAVGSGIGALLSMMSAGVQYEAAVGDAELEPALVSRQGKHRVSSLLGDAAGSVAISGDVYWEAGFSVILELDVNARTIRIHGVPGAGAGFPCAVLDPDRVVCGSGVFAINGIYGDASGRISLVGGPGFSIIPEPAEHRITIKSTITPADITCGENE